MLDGVDVDALRLELERNAMYLSGMSLSATVVLFVFCGEIK